MKKPFSDVIELFKTTEYILLTKEKEYTGHKTRLLYLCTCGNETNQTLVEFKRGSGRKCRQCSIYIRASKLKLDFDHVKSVYENNNCILLSKEYLNNNHKLRFICSCGNAHESTFDSFQQRPFCKKCGYEKAAKSIAHSYEYVKDMFEKNGCTLLSTTYAGSKKKLDFICHCGREAKITFQYFQKVGRCLKCGEDSHQKHVDSTRYAYDHIVRIFAENSCTLLTNKYINNKQLLVFKCACGNMGRVCLSDFVNGIRCKKCTSDRKSKSQKGIPRPERSGENHPQWDHTKTREERERTRLIPEYKPWRMAVYTRDKFTCQCCGDNKGGNLNAHHLDGWDCYKDKRFDVNNGITLCDTCHDDFHSLYGYGENTKKQWAEYMRNLFKENPIYKLI